MKKKRPEIIHEDEQLIIVNKPAPFLTIPDRYDKNIPSVVGFLKATRPEVFINHRLDKDTSGLVLFTKTEEAHKAMSDAFEQRKIDKHYYTIVHGQPPEEVGLIDLPIGKSSSQRKGMRIDADGKPSQTKFRIITAFKHYSFLEIKLLTGRQHQIRVHMKSVGCSVVSDKLYGDGEPFFLSKIKRKMIKSYEFVEKPLLSRLALHAHHLKFDHPVTKEPMAFSAALPKDMKAVVHQLEKWASI